MRNKIPDGVELVQRPEFQAFLKRLGIKLPETDCYVSVKFMLEYTIVSLHHKVQKVYPHDIGWCYRLPETEAWLRSIGFPYDAYTIDASVEFGPGQMPTFTLTAALTEPDDLLTVTRRIAEEEAASLARGEWPK